VDAGREPGGSVLRSVRAAQRRGRKLAKEVSIVTREAAQLPHAKTGGYFRDGRPRRVGIPKRIANHVERSEPQKLRRPYAEAIMECRAQRALRNTCDRSPVSKSHQFSALTIERNPHLPEEMTSRDRLPPK